MWMWLCLVTFVWVVQRWFNVTAANDLIMARNLAGGGVKAVESFAPDGSRRVAFSMIAGTTLYGQLPQWLINKATGAFAACHYRTLLPQPNAPPPRTVSVRPGHAESRPTH